MMTRSIFKNNDVPLIRKTLAVILAGVFLLAPSLNEVNSSEQANTLSWAKEEKLFSAGTENIAFSFRPADNNKLAAELRTTGNNFKELYKAAAICRFIEENKNLNSTSSVQNILEKLEAVRSGFENIHFEVTANGIIIEIPDEGLAIRYFDPTKANVITPYSDISKLKTKIIGPRLNRQIIHRIKALPLREKVANMPEETQKNAAGMKQQSESKKMPFRETPLPQDNKNLLLFLGLERLFGKLDDDMDQGMRQAAAQAIGEVAKNKPELITNEMIDRLFRKLDDKDQDARRAVARAMGDIAKSKPELITKEIAARLFKKLNDIDQGMRQSAAWAIGEIANSKPELITKEIVGRLFEKLDDSSYNVCQAAAWTIVEIAKSKPTLGEGIINRLFEKLDDRDQNVCQAAAWAIGEIAKSKPELITKEIVDRLFEKLNGGLQLMRQVIAQAIGEIAKSKPELGEQIIVRLFDKLNDENQAATQAIREIVGIRPELITENRVNRLFEKLNARARDLCQAVVQTIGEIAKSKPELITKEIVDRLFEKLNDDYQGVRQAAAWAIGEIAGNRPELITEEMVRRFFKKLSDKDQNVRQAVAQAIGKIAKSKPELAKEITGRLFKELNNIDQGMRQAAAQAIGEVAKNKPKLITKEIADRLSEKLNDDYHGVRQAVTQAICEIAKNKPKLITKKIMTRLFEKLNDRNREIARTICEIAKSKPELAKEMAGRLFKELNNMDQGMRQAAAQAIYEIAKSKPQLITKKMMNRLFEKLNDDYHGVRQAVTQAIYEIAKNNPQLITKKIMTRLFEKLNDYWLIRQAAALAIGEIISKSVIDFTRISHYKEEFLNSEGEFRLKEDELLSGYLVTSFFLEKEKDFGLFLDFTDRTEEDFSRLMASLAGSIEMGAGKEALDILKAKREIKEANLFLEELWLNKAGLGLYVPTGNWDNLREWLDFCGKFSGRFPDKAMAHIIVTMKLLQASIGEQMGFRAVHLIRTRFSEIRQALVRILERPLPVLAKRRLVKVLALGSPDQIDHLRNQADNLIVAVTGRDLIIGLVGMIKNKIHTQPSPQDLAVIRAYRLFAEKQDTSQLARLGYKVDASDKIPENRRQDVLSVCDNLIATLEDIYGEGSINSIQEYFQRWQGAVPGQEELKARISALLKENPDNSLGYLESIIQIRQALYALIEDLSGEELLLTILLDNRMEILFYRQFNSIKERIDFYSPREALKAMFVLLANTRLNGYSEKELNIICDELDSLTQKTVFNKEDWLRLYSIYKRVERIINAGSRSAIDDFQYMAERLSSGIIAEESSWVENFSSNIFRSDTIYLLSLALKDAKEAAMQKAGISGWQAVVPGKAPGRVRFIKNIVELDSVKPDEIIVIEQLPSETPPVTMAAAIITLKEDSLLSHPASRARQHNIPFAVCPDIALLDGLNGQWVKLVIKGDEVVLTKALEPEKNKGPPQISAKKQINIIPADLESKDFIIMPENYKPQIVGMKAARLQQIPVNLLPEQVVLRHFSLSFSLFGQVLNLEANTEIKARLLGLKAKALKDPFAADITDTLKQMRLSIEELNIPHNYLGPILETIEKVFGEDKALRLFPRSSTNAEDLAGYQAAGLYDSFVNIRPGEKEVSKYIKKVWASVWNDRAFFDRRANSIDHSGVFPAVMIQEMGKPDYAFVIHTRNPDGADRDELMIELVQGFGESLVSGQEEFAGSPYRFIYNRKTGALRLISYANKSKKLILEDGRLKAVFASYKDDKLLTNEGLEFIREVVKAAVKIEEEFGHPQDIEGAVLIQGTQWKVAFLQSRDQPLNGAEISGQNGLQGGLGANNPGIIQERLEKEFDRVLKLIEGIVRKNMIDSGLRIIADDKTFSDIMEIYSQYDILGDFASGVYLNKEFCQKSEGEQKELYEKQFKCLYDKYGPINRAIVVNENAPVVLLRHEILHDVIELSSIKYNETFKRLSNFMYYYSLRDKKFGYFYGCISRKTLGMARRDLEYRDNMLKEFVATFFSRQLSERNADSQLCKGFLYIRNNMPVAAKKLFFKLGLIFPVETDDIYNNLQMRLAVAQTQSNVIKNKQRFETAPEITEINNVPEILALQNNKKSTNNQIDYIGTHKTLFKDILGEDKPDTLVRVPIESIESIGIDNIRDFLATFQRSPNGYVELYYMSGTGEVSEVVYQKYGLQKKSLPKDFKRTRENTITLFPALKGEEINQSIVVSRLGNINVTPENTILSPIGLQHDPAGLIRATILGLKMIDIARQIKEKGMDITHDQAFKDKIQLEILEQLKNVCNSDDFKNFNLTPDDIIAIATGTINNIITALKKLIKLLPVTLVDAEELRQIYEHAKAVITAA